MANEEQLAILHQGVEVWNAWRANNLGVHIDLDKADLSGAELRNIDLQGAMLREARLNSANLTNSNLGSAILSQANLKQANLRVVNLNGTNLSEANLKEANLIGATLNSTRVRGSEFFFAKVGATTFANLDLSEAVGLEDVFHRGPSSLSTDTFLSSKGAIPKLFLSGCGLSDADIEYVKLSRPNLSNEEIIKILYKIFDLRASQAVQISPLFISYNHGDILFVNKLEQCLNAKGIRFWLDIHDAKAGKLEKQIDRAIRQNPTVLLVLSANSLSSDWVEHEVRAARALEKELRHDVLCPVALDDSWKSSRWPKRIMEQIMEYNILDFSAWEDGVKFDRMFRRLIDGLELFYKG